MATQQSVPKPSPGHSTTVTGPTCAICGRPKQLDKILVACIRCSKHYHPACHRPFPRDPFICDLCRSAIRAKSKKLKAVQNNHGIKYDSSSQTTASLSSVITSTTADTMFSSYRGSSRNPFIPDDEDSSLVAFKKCSEPNCHEKVLKGLPMCPAHLVPPPLKNKAPATDHSRNTTYGTGVRSLMRTVSPPPRKVLDAKSTSRKSGPRLFFPAEGKPKQSSSADTHTANARATHKTSGNAATEPSFSETHLKKKRRLALTKDAAGILNPRRSASPLAMPNGVLRGMKNGKSIEKTLQQPAKLPTLNDDMRSFSSATAEPGGLQRPVLSYDDYLKSPLTAGFSFELPKLSSDGLSDATRSQRGNLGSKSPQGNVSNEKISNQKAPPANVMPTRPKPVQHERVSSSPHSKLKATTRTPPMGKQRQSFIQEKIVSSLDTFIYAQSGASQPPPGAELIKPSDVKQQESVLYAPIDPRSHRMRPHSAIWYQQKEQEICSRGGRKANFAKATQRMSFQRLNAGSPGFEAALPDRVLNNEDWISALRWFDDQRRGGSRVESTPTIPVKTKRPYKRRQPASANSGERLAEDPS